MPSSRARTSGTALTGETAALTSGCRIAIGDVVAVHRDGRRERVGAAREAWLPAACGHRGRVVHVDAVAQHPPGHRAVHRAGVEVAQPEPVGHAARGAGLAGSGGAVDRDDDAGDGRCSQPVRSYRWVTQPLDSREASRCSARSSSTSSSTSPTGPAGVVVDVDVLDVDLAGAGVREEPGQLAGVVGHRHEDRPARPGGAAVLAGDREGPGHALLEQPLERGPVGGAHRVDHDVEPVAHLGRAGRGPPRSWRPGSGRRAPGRRRRPGSRRARPGRTGPGGRRALRPAGPRPGPRAGAGCARSGPPRGRARPG